MYTQGTPGDKKKRLKTTTNFHMIYEFRSCERVLGRTTRKSLTKYQNRIGTIPKFKEQGT